jgi:hypothetical protein
MPDFLLNLPISKAYRMSAKAQSGRTLAAEHHPAPNNRRLYAPHHLGTVERDVLAVPAQFVW